MKKLYIIKIGTTFPTTEKHLGDFDRWTAKTIGPVDIGLEIVDAEHGDSLPKEEECAGVVITGSHAMVTDNMPWSVKLGKWIQLLLNAQVPTFGICYGHQLLAQAAGGEGRFPSTRQGDRYGKCSAASELLQRPDFSGASKINPCPCNPFTDSVASTRGSYMLGSQRA